MFVFSKAVKDTMNHRGMSLKDLGDRVGVNSSTLSKLFSHKTKGVTLSLLHSVCRELDLTIDQVLVSCDKADDREVERIYLKDTVDRIHFLSNELSKQSMILERLHKKYETQDRECGKYVDMFIEEDII